MDIRWYIKAGMLGAAACLCVPYLPGAAFAQIYSVRRPSLSVPEPAKGPAPRRLEFYAGPVISLQPLKDDEGNTLSSAFYGMAAGLRWRLMECLALGMEGQYLPQSASQIPFTQYMRQEALYLTARWELTPDTSPVLWMEGGVGYLRTRWKLERAFPAEELVSPTAFMGMGSTFSLGRGWSGGAFCQAVVYSKDGT